MLFFITQRHKKNDESKRFHSVLSILQRISICEVQKLAAHKKNNNNNKICYRGYLSSANGLLKGWTHSKKCMCTLNKHLNSLNASNIYTFSFCTLLCVPNWRNYDGFFFSVWFDVCVCFNGTLNLWNDKNEFTWRRDNQAIRGSLVHREWVSKKKRKER